MRILVTGGGGFIGSHCVDGLVEKGHQVTVVDDFSTGRESNLDNAKALAKSKGLNLNIVKASVSDSAFWANLPAQEALFHFAAQTSVTTSVANPEKDFQTNVETILPLLQWVRRSKTRILLYANTAGVLYGDAVNFPVDERGLIQPHAPYAATKAFFELYLSAYVRSLKDSGEWSSDVKNPNFFSWASLRLANVYGPRQTAKGEAGVVPIFFECLRDGKKPTIFGDGKKTRDYVYVADVKRAFMMAFDRLQQTSFDEPMNVATGIETKDLEVFNTVMAKTHMLAREAAYASRLAKSLDIQEPSYAPIRAGEIVRSVMNIGKIDGYLGWLPEMNFEDGVLETIKSYC